MIEEKSDQLTKQELIQVLEVIRDTLDELDAKFLTGCVDGAIQVACEMVCHAINLANVSHELKRWTQADFDAAKNSLRLFTLIDEPFAEVDSK